MRYLVLISLAIFISSCFEDESPVALPDRGDLQIDSITESMYDYQTYFSLETGSFITSHPNNVWSIGFDCRPDSHFVRLNTAISARVRLSDFTSLEDINSDKLDKSDSLFTDNTNGFGETSALGKWWENPNDQIYVFREKAGLSAFSVAFYAAKLELTPENNLKITILEEGETEPIETIISKDESVNYNYVKFGESSTKSIEPNKNDWDLEFTQLTEFIATSDEENPEEIPYLVRGVYQNVNGVDAGVIANPDGKSFQEILYEDIDFNSFRAERNVIGYDWKSVDINTGTYTTDFNRYFKIKSVNGIVYKLRFTRFTNSEGRRGYPEIEFQQL